MSAAAANLTPYHTLPLLPSNLAVANLSIETLGIELFLIITVAPRTTTRATTRATTRTTTRRV
jgi:hypothetical protein